MASLTSQESKEPLHIIFLAVEREVLRYFTEQLCIGADNAAIPYYMADMSNPESLRSPLFTDILAKEKRVLVTFNQSTAMATWDKLGVPVYDLIQDHPRYFSDILSSGMKHLHPVVLDRNHGRFIKRFFPDTNPSFFLPNGGTTTLLPGCTTLMPYKERPIDVLYCGNCQTLPHALPDLPFLSHGIEQLYDACFHALVSHPEKTTEEVIEAYLNDRENSLSPEEFRLVIFNAARPVEDTVRRYYKLKTMHAIDQANISVEVYGTGWQDDDVPFSCNIRIHPRVSSAECNQMAGQAKLSLNLMPWFKDGCSERVFNNMLNGALCLTDSSVYLKERFAHNEHLVFFELDNPSALTERMRELLSDDTASEKIAAGGFEKASANDTWQHRLLQLAGHIQSGF